MKTYKTYQARNAVKAAEVTNHIIARKKEGVSHEEAKAEAYRIYKIKAAEPILSFSFKEVRAMASLKEAREGLERAMNSTL
jgi:G3E family GTPase